MGAEVATGLDAAAIAELLILADVVELLIETIATVEVELVREEVAVAVGVVVVGLGLVRVVISVATPKEKTLDEVLQHWFSPSE